MNATGETVALAEFLLARIAEDEEKASEVVEYVAGWTETDRPWVRNKAVAEKFPHPIETWDAMHDPTRVLVECEAKRRIVGLHKAEIMGGVDDCGFECRDRVCPTLAILAATYADHPDYCDEWRVLT